MIGMLYSGVMFIIIFPQNLIGGVMVSMLASSTVDHGFEPGRVKPKIVFTASKLSTQH